MTKRRRKTIGSVSSKHEDRAVTRYDWARTAARLVKENLKSGRCAAALTSVLYAYGSVDAARAHLDSARKDSNVWHMDSEAYSAAVNARLEFEHACLKHK